MQRTMHVEGIEIPIHAYDTLVVGTGAAGYNAALRLRQFGRQSIAMITEGVCTGTSRNTGSDKQTYYKLTLSGAAPDAPADMARDLFAGGSMDGDHALIEAALSARCFLHLCELGVPFPVNRYGEHVGYKTDHDPRARATSAGPLTSRHMTECLQKAVAQADIPVFDGYQAISLLVQDGRIQGVLALHMHSAEAVPLVIFAASHVILATGGPAGVYANTVYPEGHHGASGIAFEAGARGKNLTEWQYGLASTHPRWNVSGTYMQVLPRFISIDRDEKPHEFLQEYFADAGACMSAVFQKGYEWPFDSRRARQGSSVIDMLVYREEIQRGRRVYLDYRTNPFGQAQVDYGALSQEARGYLEAAGACFGTPIDRLLHMNAPAYELYLSKGVDLRTDLLEISLCAQHHNGGLDVDAWWQTSIPGLFAVGEAAGTHGMYRPGGSALNAGQVGSLRAAQYITAIPEAAPLLANGLLHEDVLSQIAGHVRLCREVLRNESNVAQVDADVRHRMSAVAAALRDPVGMEAALVSVQVLLDGFAASISAASPEELPAVYRLHDTLVTQRMLLHAMLAYVQDGGGSRGSALYLGPEANHIQDDGAHHGLAQCTQCQGGTVTNTWRAVRPLPEGGGVFETVWREYRDTGGVW